MQQYAGIYLLQNYTTCFGCISHPSSGVNQTVTAASGTGHSVSATTFRQSGLIRYGTMNIKLSRVKHYLIFDRHQRFLLFGKGMQLVTFVPL